MNAALASAALVHHADPSGVSQPHSVGMTLECSTGNLLAMAAFMNHREKEHHALKHYAVLKGLTMGQNEAVTHLTLNYLLP